MKNVICELYVQNELFTGHPALLLQRSIPLSLSYFLSHPPLTPSLHLFLYLCLFLCGCHSLIFFPVPITSPLPFFLQVSSPDFLFVYLLLCFHFECLSSSPVRASKQANSHAALLSQYNEIGSTQIERSHFLQLSTYY